MTPKKSTPVKNSPVNNTTPDFFEKAGKKGILIALLLLVVILLVVFKDFILLEKVYLYKDIGSDTLNAAYPFLYNFATYFHKYGLPTWSFEQGMGQNIAGGFLRDPFMFIAYIAGVSAMPKIFVFIECIKIATAGLIFYLLLKQLKVSNFSAIIGALLFTFSGFMIIGSSWYVFSYEALTLALVLLGFELYFQKGKWLVFVIAIISIAISMPFNLYISGLFLLFYIIFRLAQTDQLTWKIFFSFILKLCLFGLIALLISAPFFLESLFQILESPRGSGANSYFSTLSSFPVFGLIDQLQFGTFVMRFFNSNLIGVADDFKAWHNYLEAPISYCGILSIILMPQVFSFISKPAKKWYIIWALIWILPTFFPYFRYAFWLFSGDYYRIFSFCLSLVFILYSVFALDLIIRNKKISLITLAITLVICIVLLNFDYFDDGAVQKDPAISFLIYASIFIYSLLLFFISKPDSSPYWKYALVLFVCIELGFTSYSSINNRIALTTDELKQKTGYNDYSVEAVDYIKKHETGFYRIDKNYFSSGANYVSFNDNMMLDYYGTSVYNSFTDNNYINYLKAYEIISKDDELQSRWVPGLISDPMLQSLNQVKYILIEPYDNNLWHYLTDSVTIFGDVTVLKYKYTLPLGFTYKQYVKQEAFDSLSKWQKDVIGLKACVINDSDLNKIQGLTAADIKDTVPKTAFTFDSYRDDIIKLKQDTLQLASFSDTKISGKIISQQPEIMYLSFPYDKGWHLILDGQKTELLNFNNGMTGIYLTQGNHQIELNYKLRYFYKGLWLMFSGVLLLIVLFIMDVKGVSFLKPKDQAA
jgi:uncharacterized membrane protein YfhO